MGQQLRGGRCYSQDRRVKELVKDRDGRACRLCGLTEADGAILEADHIVPWRESHDSTLANLRCLCLKCNRKTRVYTGRRALPVDEYDAWLRRELAACGEVV